MAVTAMDMAMPIQRTPEMTRQMGESRPELQNQQFAERLTKETNQQEQQVQQTPQSEEAFIQKDGRGNNAYERNKGKKKGKKGQSNSAKGFTQSSSSMFDVSV
jgi:hypothetical protein